ncbi:ribosome silencing factor [Planomicrobium sp. CPCC 101079]|uniref:ribosome silencing factor n=1 Tax=Planomicrobium sp. CPCC 101079 TaxID=2599618 RepID=UPI0011B65B35|nr:ribosome silencing factor [Planomicrobium sp. CPCC 101079]TWT09074.1 ribosome silencing factor [Planomicrobium sp. CPCC 101079]
MTKETLLQTAYNAAEDKKAEDIVVLNMAGISLLADYFIICSGNSDRQVQAIAKELIDKSNESGNPVKSVEGFDAARWILIDMGDVVAHVFHKDERSYYNLERLWREAPTMEI